MRVLSEDPSTFKMLKFLLAISSLCTYGAESDSGATLVCLCCDTVVYHRSQRLGNISGGGVAANEPQLCQICLQSFFHVNFAYAIVAINAQPASESPATSCDFIFMQIALPEFRYCRI